jgi:hypothetical protein
MTERGKDIIIKEERKKGTKKRNKGNLITQ